MSRNSSIVMFAILFTAYLATIVDWIKVHFVPPVERVRGLITYVACEVRAVAYQAKSWCYAMFARWRVDSYSMC